MHFNACNKALKDSKKIKDLFEDLHGYLSRHPQCLDVRVARQWLREAEGKLDEFREVIRRHEYSSRRAQSE